MSIDPNSEPFSSRHGFSPSPAEITVRQDAPAGLRFSVIQIAQSDMELSPSSLRSIICGVLHQPPDASNWSEYPNIWGEVQWQMERCEWYRVYDIAEAIYAYLKKLQSDGYTSRSGKTPRSYEQKLNEYFYEMGIGWQMTDGVILSRGDEISETLLDRTTNKLENSPYSTTRQEIQEAILDLSRRPESDLTGAIHHSWSALEALARAVSGDKGTLGEVLNRHPDVFPKTLTEALKKGWGFASEEARHGREGRQLDFADVEFAVFFANAAVNYLLSKLPHAIHGVSEW